MKQIPLSPTHQRQHYIALLERILAVAFRIFRNTISTNQSLSTKLTPLLKKTADYMNVILNGEGPLQNA